MWIAIGIIVLILEVASSSVFNTTTCFEGGKGPYSIECKKNGSETGVDIIALRNVYYGTKLKDACDEDECCLPNKTIDCIYRRNDRMDHIIKACSGNVNCTYQANPQFNAARCKNASQYSLFTHFALLEYECINIQKLVDICDTGVTKRDNSLYLTSNIFSINDQMVNTTCSCVVSTKCNNTIQILAVDVRLTTDEMNSDCYEELVITDGNTTKTITCQDTGLYAFKHIFTSISNVVHLDLNTGIKHMGKVWIQVQGTEDKSEIEVRCGDTIRLPIYNNHMCEMDKSTTQMTSESPTSHISISPTTAECTDCDMTNQEKQSGLSADVIGGVSAAVIIIILILVVILFLVCRSPRIENNGSNENIYNNSIEENQYETSSSPTHQATGGPVGVTNSAYHFDKEGKDSDEHPYSNDIDDNNLPTKS